MRLSLVVLENIIWPTLVLVFLLFAFLHPEGMLTGRMLTDITYSSIPLGFLVLAEALVLLNGCFDLSVGQIAGLSAAVGAVVAEAGWLPEPLLPLVPICVGIACGAFNGVLVGFLNLNAFLVTLGTFIAFDGIQLLIQHTVIYELPEFYLLVGGNVWLTIGLFLLLLSVLQIVIHRSKFGVHFIAVGSTPDAAQKMGISVKKHRMLAFVLSGALSGLAGLAFTGYTTAYGPQLAEGTVFTAFAAAVLGGISLNGGRGRVMNVFGGVLLLGVISSGLTVLALSPYARRTIFGLLVIAAIFIDAARNRVRERVMRAA